MGNSVESPRRICAPAFIFVGAVLATAALDALKADGAQVLPQCWLVRDVIAARPDDYLAMVPADERSTSAYRRRDQRLRTTWPAKVGR